MALLKIGKAARTLGVDRQTLVAWEKTGELVPDRRSRKGTRYYEEGKVLGLGTEELATVGYARVSSVDQLKDLECQRRQLEAYCRG